MITLEELVEALNMWARHMLGGSRGRDLGLPHHCTYLEFAIKGNVHDSDVYVPDDIWKTDQLVRSLGEVEPYLRMVIERHYMGGSIEDNHKGLNVSRSTYDRRLEEAHQMLISLYTA